MRFVEPLSQQAADDLDGLLRAFFRSQMPQPWPKPRLPRSAVTSAPLQPSSGRTLIRSRWALAASIGVLLLGSMLLPSRFTPEAKPDNNLSGQSISGNDLRRKMDREHKNRQSENKNNPGFAADKDDQLPEMDEADMPFMK